MRLGVVVGRFQTPFLHDGHAALLEAARVNSDHVLIILGVSAIAGTKRNPLDYATRHRMVAVHMQTWSPLFPYSIEPLSDCEDDKSWSEALDHRIRQHMKFGDEVTLYGGEDSFLDCYAGAFDKHHRLSMNDEWARATHYREAVKNEPPLPAETFRRGIIYAIGNMRNTVSATVDVACIATRPGLNMDHKDASPMVLVGRKPGEKKWRFPGGFVDATDKSMVAAARREFFEETGLSVEGQMHYVGTNLVDDWRFRNSPDKAVMTTLYACNYNFGQAKAADDLEEVKWMPLTADGQAQMNKGHGALFAMLLLWLKDYRSLIQ